MEGTVKKVCNARFTVNALRILEQVAEEVTSVGILFGVKMIHGCLRRVANRAKELHDEQLDDLMNVMHLYDDDDESGVKNA